MHDTDSTSLVQEYGPKRALGLAVVLVLAAVVYWVSPKFPDYSVGQRAYYSLNGAQHRAAKLLGRPALDPSVIPPPVPGEFDDPGLRFLAVGVYLAQPSYLGVPSTKAVPPAYLWLMGAVWVGAMGAFFWFGSATVGLLATLVSCFLFISSPTVRYVAFSGDIYIVPFLGVIAALGGWFFFRRTKPPLLAVGVCVLVILVCEKVRSPTWVVALFWLLLPWSGRLSGRLAFPRIPRSARRYVWVALAFFLLLFAAYKKSSRAAHPVWHALHAGMMEFGGWIGADSRMYPDFMGAPGEVGAKRVETWNDWYSYNYVAAGFPRVPPLSSEYEALVKKDYFDKWKAAPFGFFAHHLRRLWVLLDVDIWSGGGEVMPNRSGWRHWVVSLFAILSLVVLAALDRPRFWAIGSLFVLAGAPSLLVFSSGVQFSLVAKMLLLFGIASAVAAALRRVLFFRPFAS